MNELKEVYQFLIKRTTALQHEIELDKGGGLAFSLAKWQEAKFWKEYIERNYPEVKE